MIKFSIIVPVYNTKMYLPQCLNSILEQTYGNYEVICVDDGSDDGSGEVLEQFARKDERFRIIHKKNTGYGDTLNIGMETASGEYIGILESDDYFAANMLEEMASVLDGDPCGIEVVKAMFYQVSREGCNRQKLFDPSMCGRIIEPADYPGLFSIQPSVWSAVYRKSFLMDNRIEFLRTPGASYQDTSFSFKVWVSAKKIYLLDEPLLYYRIDNTSSSIHSSDKIFSVCDEINEINRYMRENKLQDDFMKGISYVYTYRSYMWNYYRLPLEGRLHFWPVMLNTFQEFSKQPSFLEKYWLREDWLQINRVVEQGGEYLFNTNPSIMETILDSYTIKEDIYQQAILNFLRTNEKLVIYGAGVYGKKVLELCRSERIQESILGFAVTDSRSDADSIEGYRVFGIEELTSQKEEILVIAAVAPASQWGILQHLAKLGFKRVMRADPGFIQLLNRNATSD